jgi:hypothetical protein
MSRVAKKPANPQGAKQAKRAKAAPAASSQPPRNGKAVKPAEPVTLDVYRTGKVFNGKEFNGFTGSFELIVMDSGVVHLFFAEWNRHWDLYLKEEVYVSTHPNLKEGMRAAKAAQEAADKKYDSERTKIIAEMERSERKAQRAEKNGAKKNGGAK